MENETKLKKIVFYDTPKKHADLKVRWQYDSMKQSEFFRLIVDAYLDQDERILSLVEQHKANNKIQNNKKREKTKRSYENARETKKMFSLEEGEVESIFDLLEKEHPDL
mgnify:CR=1 FL=1